MTLKRRSSERGCASAPVASFDPGTSASLDPSNSLRNPRPTTFHKNSTARVPAVLTRHLPAAPSAFSLPPSLLPIDSSTTGGCRGTQRQPTRRLDPPRKLLGSYLRYLPNQPTPTSGPIKVSNKPSSPHTDDGDEARAQRLQQFLLPTKRSPCSELRGHRRSMPSSVGGILHPSLVQRSATLPGSLV